MDTLEQLYVHNWPGRTAVVLKRTEADGPTVSADAGSFAGYGWNDRKTEGWVCPEQTVETYYAFRFNRQWTVRGERGCVTAPLGDVSQQVFHDSGK